MKKNIIIGFMLSFILASNLFAGVYGSEIKFDQEELKVGDIDIIIDRVFTGGQDTNYYLMVKVRNNSKDQVVFDTGDLELVDDANKMTYYSISKDKSSVSVPMEMSNLLTRSTINPDRMISGMIWITTPPRETEKIKDFKLYYKNQFVQMHYFCDINMMGKPSKKQAKKK